MKKTYFFSIFIFLCIWIAFTPAFAAGAKGYAVRDCPVMDEPYRDAQEIASLEKGTTVSILRRKGGWMKISTEITEGWVRMLNIRRGTQGAKPNSASETKGVLNLASGRSGSGNVVAATGVRGLSEEELKEAEYNAAEIKKLESFSTSKGQAEGFAKAAGLKSRKVEFLP